MVATPSGPQGASKGTESGLQGSGLYRRPGASPESGCAFRSPALNPLRVRSEGAAVPITGSSRAARADDGEGTAAGFAAGDVHLSVHRNPPPGGGGDGGGVPGLGRGRGVHRVRGSSEPAAVSSGRHVVGPFLGRDGSGLPSLHAPGRTGPDGAGTGGGQSRASSHDAAHPLEGGARKVPGPVGTLPPHLFLPPALPDCALPDRRDRCLAQHRDGADGGGFLRHDGGRGDRGLIVHGHRGTDRHAPALHRIDAGLAGHGVRVCGGGD